MQICAVAPAVEFLKEMCDRDRCAPTEMLREIFAPKSPRCGEIFKALYFNFVRAGVRCLGTAEEFHLGSEI